MHPLDHAKTSASLWGGKPEDYLPVHEWMDAPKEHFGDWRHRAMRHHSQGIFECERVLGRTIQLSNGRTAMTRYVAEQHVREDCAGIIPSMSDWFRNIKREGWMAKGYPIRVAEPQQGE